MLTMLLAIVRPSCPVSSSRNIEDIVPLSGLAVLFVRPSVDNKLLIIYNVPLKGLSIISRIGI
jgi:hypothetical protein